MKNSIRMVVDPQKETKKATVIFIFVLILALMAITLVVYQTGGTKNVYPHLYYIPILFSALLYGKRGGIIVAVIASLMMGPLMPLDVEMGIDQSKSAYFIRLAFFLFTGIFVGSIADLLKTHFQKVQENLDKICVIYANTLENYARMVSARDEQIAFHSERVAYNSALIGKSIGLNEMEIETIYWSGLLHDVGKIGVQESILLKPGKLTEDEFTLMKKHSEIGYNLIHSLTKEFEPVAEGIKYHHERWNGTGYPNGLNAEEIPLSARIIAVVDVFEALTSERPYKKAWKPDEAIQYLIDHKGMLFDPFVVDQFQQLYDQRKIWIFNHPIQLDEQIKPIKLNKSFLK